MRLVIAADRFKRSGGRRHLQGVQTEARGGGEAEVGIVNNNAGWWDMGPREIVRVYGEQPDADEPEPRGAAYGSPTCKAPRGGGWFANEMTGEIETLFSCECGNAVDEGVRVCEECVAVNVAAGETA